MVLTIASERARWADRIRFAVALALIAGTLLVPPGALAHAELDTVAPVDKSTVQGSPTEIVMTFTQHLDPAKSSIRLVDAGGTVIAQDSTVDADRTTMRLAIATPLAAGTYTTRWTSFSADDGEQDRGTTTFTVVAAPSAAPSAGSSAATPSASAAAPTAVPSAVAPSAAPSPAPAAPSASTGDVVIPVVVALIVLAGLGLWLLRGRGRAR